MKWGGQRMERLLESYVDRLGWLTVALIAVYIVVKTW